MLSDKNYENFLNNFVDENHTINVYAGSNDNTILSNLGLCSFEWNNMQWNSVEQAYMYCKAKFSKSENIAERILNETDPFKIKFLGKSIKNSDKWRDTSYKIMYKLIECSLRNEEKRSALIRTGNAMITHRPDKSIWSELFPKILMILRHQIR